MPVESSLVVVVLLALVVLFVVFKTAVVVPQQSAYVVERLGRYSATLNAGFHILVPFVDVIRYRHTLQETAIDIAAPGLRPCPDPGVHRTPPPPGPPSPATTCRWGSTASCI